MNASHDLSLDLLRVLDALLEDRHVTKAARRLGMTQSATSHALARLRQRFGDPLFVRGPRGVVATARAEALGPEVRAVLERIDGLATAGAPFDPRTLRRRFVIGGSDYSELLLLPQLVAALQREAPGVDILSRAEPGHDVENAMARGQLDAMLGVQADAPPRLIQKKLFDDTFVCLFRRGHPALSEKLTAARFAALRHVLIAPGGGGTGVVDDVLGERGLSRRIVVHTATFQSAPLMVEASDAVTTMPRRIAEVLTKGRRIEVVPTPVKLPGFTLSLTFHERSRSDPGHQWLRERIATIARAV